MSNQFRELLKKIGSGAHTSKDLSRTEAKEAMRMMLHSQATPAQIGAYMIAHRIKRPTAEELAGMLDAYHEIGPKLKPFEGQSSHLVTVLGTPYDGRNRTSPVTPITALMLAISGVPIIMHGGDCMPTKFGIPMSEIWQNLGVDFTNLSLIQAQQLLEKTGLTFVYLPQHFPQANQLVPYREQIGKRPPIATLELIWSPYAGDVRIIAGFVHPPTEERFCHAVQLTNNITQLTTIKGLEGSCDLARSRTGIIGVCKPDGEPDFERIFLHPHEYGFAGKDVPLESIIQLAKDLQNIIQGKPIALMQEAIWNGGFYLWHCGICADINTGFAQAEGMLIKGKVAAKLKEITQAIEVIKSSDRLSRKNRAANC
ncbi:MAG: anthranilate phosphoribosyltransferase family protein [Oscillatoria sp. PMC 1051.18]|nr:anthranilate phosphoribosyltransferase family protein [Oscillatoria sp. PMC 1050.18]MEC5029328.1 anthranilate phosphoribosyltransferase family protein [Oscillatoria sp. PMC 1051.18]